jgi:hypothetical protein
VTVLFAAAGGLVPASSKSQIRFQFLLPWDAEALELTFSYMPKALGECDRARELVAAGMSLYEGASPERIEDEWRSRLPLNNLLTLSLDSPSGFRGAAHRQSPRQEISVSRFSASPGFLPGPIEAGFWAITISVHAVITESCAYELEVRA